VRRGVRIRPVGDRWHASACSTARRHSWTGSQGATTADWVAVDVVDRAILGAMSKIKSLPAKGPVLGPGAPHAMGETPIKGDFPPQTGKAGEELVNTRDMREESRAF